MGSCSTNVGHRDDSCNQCNALGHPVSNRNRLRRLLQLKQSQVLEDFGLPPTVLKRVYGLKQEDLEILGTNTAGRGGKPLYDGDASLAIGWSKKTFRGHGVTQGHSGHNM